MREGANILKSSKNKLVFLFVMMFVLSTILANSLSITAYALTNDQLLDSESHLSFNFFWNESYKNT